MSPRADTALARAPAQLAQLQAAHGVALQERFSVQTIADCAGAVRARHRRPRRLRPLAFPAFLAALLAPRADARRPPAPRAAPHHQFELTLVAEHDCGDHVLAICDVCAATPPPLACEPLTTGLLHAQGII
jgi:hypothetical protein